MSATLTAFMAGMNKAVSKAAESAAKAATVAPLTPWEGRDYVGAHSRPMTLRDMDRDVDTCTARYSARHRKDAHA